MRTDGRKPNELREVEIKAEVNHYAEGSVKISFGKTIVLCTASVEERIPKWLQGTKQGWVTAEYGMLPRSTHNRINRDKANNSGRTQEISRLIGRSLRACIDLSVLGERQIYVDCDVLQADGGTRTAAITGGFVALSLACKFLQDQKIISAWPIKNYISAISVGLNNDQALLDLNYDEDSNIGTDMNFVMDDSNRFIEIQGTAEKTPFSKDHLNQLIEFAEIGCKQLIGEQEKILGSFFKPQGS